jgi:hypothetical protein
MAAAWVAPSSPVVGRTRGGAAAAAAAAADGGGGGGGVTRACMVGAATDLGPPEAA